MWLLLSILLYAQPLSSEIFDIPGDVEMLLYGNLKDYNKFFFLPIEEQRKHCYKEGEGKVTLDDFKHFTSLSDPGDASTKKHKRFKQDIDDFNRVDTRRLLQSTPKDFSYFTHWFNAYFGKTDYVDQTIAQKDLENVKKDRLININLMFLLHARYKIGFALKTRSKIRHNSQYMMGYLMSKLKRFQYIQQNLAFLAEKNWHDKNTRNFQLLLRMYEEMVRINVDTRDMIQYLKDISQQYENYCSIDPTANCTR